MARKLSVMVANIKVALILPGSIWYAPYVRNYTRIFDEVNVDYSIISWNREGDDKPEGFQYNEICKKGHSSAGFGAYRGYVKFIKKTIKENGFNRIVVFGPQITCLLSLYLLRNFRNRYIIDYRDLSVEQKIGFKQVFSFMLRYSSANVISSPGFKKCLPKRDYYMSHNFDERAVRIALENKSKDENFNLPEGKIDVLTIGAIRDFSSNIQVAKALVNKDGVTLRFVGKGQATVDKLKSYCNEVNAANISFVGYYEKQVEAEYVKSCSFMNIFYPRIITHDTALSNRFYNSLIYHRPMLVTKDTCQGDYVEKYDVGIALENCDNLAEKLVAFLKKDYSAYCTRCEELLAVFLDDQEKFVGAVKDFVS